MPVERSVLLAPQQVDPSFAVDLEQLTGALSFLRAQHTSGAALPPGLPEDGLDEPAALDALAPRVLGAAAYLDQPLAFAHMDPPTPWITWALSLWNARLNQNLLHPATGPFARDAEQLVVSWLAAYFGMGGGHMTAGSTLANLTALWAARELRSIRRVIASEAAHISIRKAARLLGLSYEPVGVDRQQRLIAAALPASLSDAVLVLTAGTTGVGAIDPLELCSRAAWTHVDAAWAGPLVFSANHASRLDGIQGADSIAVSAHKWLFQPKESALVFFREPNATHDALSFGGGYLAAPNVGILGSHGAAAIPLLGTLLAWGRKGLAARIDRCMAMAHRLAEALATGATYRVFDEPATGVVAFRPRSGESASVLARLPQGLASSTVIEGETWLRCVAANPNADIGAIISCLEEAVSLT